MMLHIWIVRRDIGIVWVVTPSTHFPAADFVDGFFPWYGFPDNIDFSMLFTRFFNWEISSAIVSKSNLSEDEENECGREGGKRVFRETGDEGAWIGWDELRGGYSAGWGEGELGIETVVTSKEASFLLIISTELWFRFMYVSIGWLLRTGAEQACDDTLHG